MYFYYILYYIFVLIYVCSEDEFSIRDMKIPLPDRSWTIVLESVVLTQQFLRYLMLLRRMPFFVQIKPNNSRLFKSKDTNGGGGGEPADDSTVAARG